MTELIRRARRRQYTQLAMRGIAGALAVILGGCALLLVTGMPRYGLAWAAALLGAAIAAGLWRMWDGIGDEYSTARLVDLRLGLNDAISTAVFFENAEGRAAVEFQRRAAEEEARKADAARALPYAMPRAAYACGALVVLCASLVAVRFGMAHGLNLEAPLASIPWPGAERGTGFKEVARAKKGARSEGGLVARTGEPAEAWKNPLVDDEKAADGVLQTVDEPDVENAGAGQKSGDKAAGGAEQKGPDGDASGKKGEAGDPKADGDSGAEGKSPGERGADAGKQPGEARAGKSERNPPDGRQNPGLMDRMRDAVSDLMSKLKSSTASAEAKQAAASKSANEARAQRQAGSNTAKAESSQEQGAPDENAKGQAGAQAGQKMEATRGEAGDKNAARSDSADSKSGVGSQDGDKEAKMAEQVAAMGKISELIGKRSASVTGEMMVEVASGKQQLKTQYSNQRAEHTGAGGDVDRDEVPLAYQAYVRQYFEEIRKQPSKKAGVRGDAPGAAQ